MPRVKNYTKECIAACCHRRRIGHNYRHAQTRVIPCKA